MSAQGQQKGNQQGLNQPGLMQNPMTTGYGGGGFYSMGNSLRGRPDFLTPPGHPFGRPGAPGSPDMGNPLGRPGAPTGAPQTPPMDNPLARGPNPINGNFGPGQSIGGLMGNALSRSQYDPYGLGRGPSGGNFTTGQEAFQPGGQFYNPGLSGASPLPLGSVPFGQMPGAAGQVPNYGGPSQAPNPNMDPNSQEYANYYYSLAPSTRAYMHAPGSQGAQYAFNLQNNPNVMHF